MSIKVGVSLAALNDARTAAALTDLILALAEHQSAGAGVPEARTVVEYLEIPLATHQAEPAAAPESPAERQAEPPPAVVRAPEPARAPAAPAAPAAPTSAEARAEAPSPSSLADRYHAFVRNLPPRSQEFLRMVEERGTVTIGEVMRALGLHQPKAMGGITGSIGRWAPVKGVPLPYQQTERDGERAWRWIGIPGVTRGAHVPAPKPRSAPAIATPPAPAEESPPTLAPPPVRPARRAPPASPTFSDKPRGGGKGPAPKAPGGRRASAGPVVEVKGKGVIAGPAPAPVAAVAEAPARAPKKATPPAPAAAAAAAAAAAPKGDFLSSLPEESRRFMEILKSSGTLTMADALKTFNKARPVALGSVIEPIKRIAKDFGIEVPFEVGSGPDGKRVYYWPGASASAAAAPPAAAPAAEEKAQPGVIRRKRG